MNQISKRVSPPRTYRKLEDLKKINYNREAEFVFKDGSIYYGWCDGEIGADGYFYIESTVGHSAHKLEYLEKWRYL